MTTSAYNKLKVPDWVYRNMDSSLIDSLRKRRFFYYCIVIGTIVTLGFAVIDFFENELFEVVLDLIFAGVLVSSYLAMKKLNKDMWVYRMGLLFLSIIYLIAMAVGTGDGTILYWMSVLPLIYLFFLGKREGIVWIIIAAVLMVSILFAPFAYPYGMKVGFRFMLAFIFVSVFAVGLEVSRHQFSELLMEKRRQLIDEKQHLEQALHEINTLSGLLPICASCKKIRDDEGYWQDVAVYFRDRTDVDFSHGICPDCFEALYPQLPRIE